jgi:hypothetical protein
MLPATEKGRKMRTSLFGILATVFVLALAGTAMGQSSPTQDAYGGVLGNEVQNDSQGSGTAPAATQELGANAGDSLPFTGFEAGLVALAGAGLVALGFAMRRTSRRTSD